MIPQVMGILNVTPDSFSDGGRYVDLDAAVEQARCCYAAGASVVDVGGESTRPGAVPVGLDEELRRVVPVVEAIAGLGGRVSVDTRRAEVARAAVRAGATLINDVSATLWPVAADLGVGWIAMHMQGLPSTMQDAPTYADVVAEVRAFLVDVAESALTAGVPEVWIDPGFGFGKSVDHNLALVADIGEFVATGHAVLLGVSRKQSLGVLAAAADGAPSSTAVPPHERVEMGVALATWAMMAGVQMIRVHDVAPHVEAAAVVAATRSSNAAAAAPAGG